MEKLSYLNSRRAILVLNLAIVIALAWVVSLWFNLGLTSILGVLDKADQKSSPAVAVRVQQVDYSVISKRNIFNPDSPFAVSDMSPAGDGAYAPATTLPLELVGTIITDNPDKNMAVIIKGGGIQELYKVSDTIASNATITRIERFSVYIDNNGREELLYLDIKAGFPSTEGRTSSLASSEYKGGPGVRMIAPGHAIVEKGYYQHQLKDMSKLLTQVRAIPSKNKDGIIDGFMLIEMQKGSVYSKVGLRNNDTIKKINGQLIDSAEKGLELLTVLKQESYFTIDILRNRKPETLIVEVQ